MADIGVQPHVIEAVLNHVSGHKAGVAAVRAGPHSHHRPGSFLERSISSASGGGRLRIFDFDPGFRSWTIGQCRASCASVRFRRVRSR
jgi:hypothetical protein